MSAYHYFNVELAMEVGIPKAILLENLAFWIEKNMTNEKHYHNGRYWTYNSARAFSKLFPYMNTKTIERQLISLERDGYIISDNYNKTTYDKTKWYALTEKLDKYFKKICQKNICRIDSSFCLNGKVLNEETIPYNKQYNNIDNNIIINNKTHIENFKISQSEKCEFKKNDFKTSDLEAIQESLESKKEMVESKSNGEPTIVQDYKEIENADNQNPTISQAEKSQNDSEAIPTPSSTKKSSLKAKIDYTENFEEFWQQYPRKEDKAAAFKIYTSIFKKLHKEEAEALQKRMVASAKQYKLMLLSIGSTKRFTKLASTWLNNQCWENEYEVETTNNNKRMTKLDDKGNASGGEYAWFKGDVADLLALQEGRITKEEHIAQNKHLYEAPSKEFLEKQERLRQKLIEQDRKRME